MILVSDGMDFAQPGATWKAVEAIAFEDAGDASVRDLDVIITGEIPNNAHGPEIVGLAQVQDLLCDFRRGPIDGILGGRLLGNQARLAIRLIERLPTVEACPATAKVPASLGEQHDTCEMLENAERPRKYTLCVGSG